MTPVRSLGRWGLLGGAGLVVGLSSAIWLAPGRGASAVASTEVPATEFTQLDLEKVQGAEACGECHALEYEAWQKTPHATGFKELHLRPGAEDIAGKMGLHLIKRNSLCLRCHFTPMRVEQGLRALSGVSCESCHGEGADWIEVHNDYGGKGKDWSNETPEHRAMRLDQSRQAGMRRPEDLYGLAAACFECHFVPHEKLVNVGGHSTGAATFDLWQRSQGVVRHNFLAAQRGGSRDNVERGIERQRLMATTGAALAVEYALRGAANAEQGDGLYIKAMQRRLRTVIADLGEVQRRLQRDEIDVMLRVASTVRAEADQTDALLQAAETVREQTLALLTDRREVNWSSLDAYLEGEPEGELPELPDYRPARRSRQRITENPTAAAGEEPGVAAAPALAATADFDPTVLPNGEPVIFEAVGDKKQRVRATDGHRTLGGACSSCHASQNQWWFDDTHYSTADRLFDADPRAREIAANYGVALSDLARGNQVCTDCHATVVSGRESRDVQDGVGCESCHGAAADYVEIHQEGEKELGTSRPGYRAALDNGMVELQRLGVRLGRCTSCHYINDERLISSGHPSGSDFDFAGGMSTIRHWESAVESSSEIRNAAAAALRSRGPVPDVAIVTPLSQRPRPPGQPARATSAEPTAPATDRAARRSERRAPARSRAGGSPAGTAAQAQPTSEARPLEVDPDNPLPQVEEEGSLDELMRSVADRIEALKERVAPPPEGSSEEDPP